MGVKEENHKGNTKAPSSGLHKTPRDGLVSSEV